MTDMDRATKLAFGMARPHVQQTSA
jgi:hypothetical protein